MTLTKMAVLALLLAGCSTHKEAPLKEEILHCWDLKAHSERWHKDVLADSPSSLVAADKCVLANLPLEGTAAYASEGGKEIWKSKLDLFPTSGHHESVVRDHFLYASSGQNVLKLDLTKGESVWSQPETAVLLEQQGTSPVFSMGDTVTARNADTGKPLWAHPLERKDVLAVAGDLFFTSDGPYLEARQNSDAAPLWKVECPPDFISLHAIFADGSLLLNSGTALARLDLKTHKFLWHTLSPQPDGQLSAAAVFGNSLLTISSGRGEPAHALDFDWKTGAVNRDVDLGKKIDGSARANRWIDTQTLLAVESDKHLMWLDPWNAKVLAETTGEFASPSADASNLYFLEMRR